MLVEEMLTIVLETHNPKHFIFDGAFPYRGMLNSIYGRTEINKVWMRRGMFRKGSTIPVDAIKHFDLIIHPNDAIEMKESEFDHQVPALRVPAITLLQNHEMLSKKKARIRLNLPEAATVTYVQLGAGQINDIDSEIRMTIESLLEHEGMHIVLGESMLGKRLDIDFNRVHILRDYPNSMYFKAFDYSIQAGGYNSFHEMRNIGMPTLFYPNMSTGMDDQLARCKVAESEKWGLVVEYRTVETIQKGIKGLLKVLKRDAEETTSGSVMVAEQLLEQWN